ncbi:DUF488 domain-containing protein [Streptomyces olivochromogenes]|uniref:DUF488 domain-containing protein n=1 Tax=Streptomyces olivochromogenes TaxID=1963 RepID=UPI0036A938E7
MGGTAAGGPAHAAFPVVRGSKRIYEDTSSRNGNRVLVDRLRPRGMSKERAHLDEWLGDVAPSAALRHWHHHDQERFAEFRDRYIGEVARRRRYSEPSDPLLRHPAGLADCAAAGSSPRGLCFTARQTGARPAAHLPDELAQ